MPLYSCSKEADIACRAFVGFCNHQTAAAAATKNQLLASLSASIFVETATPFVTTK
jgi:hypothetical protein